MPNINNIPTTQYVGPKIVPHLWNPVVWSATTQYDALAVVQYNGDGYVSRYIPPVGTPPTDDEYWVKWADFNAQLANLQQTVDTFDARIDGAETSVDNLSTSLNTEITNRTNADTSLGNRITTETTARTNADTALGNRITALEQSAVTKKEIWVVIGDSFSYPQQTPDYNNWIELIEYRHSNIEVHNYSRNGAGYVHSTGTIFQTQAAQAVSDSTFDNDDVTRVIVYGGINDISSNEPLSNVQANASATANTLITNFKNAKISFHMNWTANVLMSANNLVYCRNINAILRQYGFKLDMASAYQLMNFPVSNVFQNDSVHPNAAGHGILAGYFYNGFEAEVSTPGQMFQNSTKVATTPTVLSQNPNATISVVSEPFDYCTYDNGKVYYAMPQRTYNIQGLSSDTVGISFPLNNSFHKYSNFGNMPLNATIGLTGGVKIQNPRAWFGTNDILVAFDKPSGSWPSSGVNMTISLSACFPMV